MPYSDKNLHQTASNSKSDGCSSVEHFQVISPPRITCTTEVLFNRPMNDMLVATLTVQNSHSIFRMSFESLASHFRLDCGRWRNPFLWHYRLIAVVFFPVLFPLSLFYGCSKFQIHFIELSRSLKIPPKNVTPFNQQRKRVESKGPSNLDGINLVSRESRYEDYESIRIQDRSSYIVMVFMINCCVFVYFCFSYFAGRDL